MRTIITGATGFLGRNLAESLREDGLEVLATGRSLAIGDELRKSGIRFEGADILDLNQLKDAFIPADCVIHCAAKSGDWGRYSDFYEANVVGTRNVVDACRTHNIKKIIFISSPSIYFTGKDRLDISESDPLPETQLSHYAKTKVISEKDLTALQQDGFRVIRFRPRAICGPHDNTFVPRILRMAEKKQFPLVNDGQALVDVTCVENFIDAIRNSLIAPDDAWNEAYNISNGDPITVKDWFALILEIFDRPFKPRNVPESAAKIIAGIMEFAGHLPFGNKEPSMTRFAVGYMAKSMTMKIDKARQKLGYSPRIGIREGFERYAKIGPDKIAPGKASAAQQP
jgi:nucleoside-diphosphate-sugar epimerase